MRDDAITLERSCAVPADRVWETLIRPVLWWGDDVVLEPFEGGRFHEPWRDGVGQHHTRGRVVKINPPRLLQLSWKDDGWSFETDVAVRLLENGNGCRIVLTHRGWNGAPESDRARLVAAHLGGWKHHLGSLASCAETRHLNETGPG
ncbi:uncharacterized protein YndB with AHSA1/START domain [Labrenzia sp. EL_13]|nr:uncharacterized protein YndB with AHSA1/START domain [Labrenzia sp. EL_13]